MKKQILPRPICPQCQQPIKDDWREIAITNQLLQAIWKVYKWSEEKGKTEFKMGDIGHLLDTKQYATFNNVAKVAPAIISSEKKGEYKIDLEWCDKFFKGEVAIPVTAWRHGITKETRPDKLAHISEVPALTEFLDQDGDYIARYRK